MTARLVLASASVHRQALLRNAGIPFETRPSELDERAIEEPLLQGGADAQDIALVLAEAKAVDVSERDAEGLVIGADQTLGLEGELFHKPADAEEARRTLLRLSGRTHELHSAVVLAQGGVALWRHVETARITLRDLAPPEIGRYVAAVGDAALTSVGAYQIEGRGIRLVRAIEGDLFTVIGLPLLPLLAELRRLGALDE